MDWGVSPFPSPQNQAFFRAANQNRFGKFESLIFYHLEYNQGKGRCARNRGRRSRCWRRACCSTRGWRGCLPWWQGAHPHLDDATEVNIWFSTVPIIWIMISFHSPFWWAVFKLAGCVTDYADLQVDHVAADAGHAEDAELKMTAMVKGNSRKPQFLPSLNQLHLWGMWGPLYQVPLPPHLLSICFAKKIPSFMGQLNWASFWGQLGAF